MTRRPRDRRPHRTGFTLVELLLVLAVLATLAAVAVPAFLRVFDDYALKESAEAVRDDLTRARLSAAEQGVVYQFRAEVDGPHWAVVPAEREPVGGSADPLASADLSDYVPVRSGLLSTGVTFAGARAATDGGGPIGGRLDLEYFAGLPDAAALAQLSWADPVLFFPDGTSAGATVTLADDQGRALPIAVRALTGAATVGEIGANPALRGMPQ